MTERDEKDRDTDPAPAPHLACSECGAVVIQNTGGVIFVPMHHAALLEGRMHPGGLLLVHVDPVCGHWRARTAVAVDPDHFQFKETNDARKTT